MYDGTADTAEPARYAATDIVLKLAATGSYPQYDKLTPAQLRGCIEALQLALHEAHLVYGVETCDECGI